MPGVCAEAVAKVIKSHYPQSVVNLVLKLHREGVTVSHIVYPASEEAARCGCDKLPSRNVIAHWIKVSGK